MFFDHVDDVALLEEKYLTGKITPYDFLDDIEPVQKKSETIRPDRLKVFGEQKPKEPKIKKMITKEEMLQLFLEDLTHKQIKNRLNISLQTLCQIIGKLGIEEEDEARGERVRIISRKNRRKRRTKAEIAMSRC